ncbi:Sugar phosphatase YidA [compost metagenome]
MKIKKEEIICIGDADNDRHMVEYAGLGVAMENAIDDIKNISQYITSSNNDDGVAEVIEKFILNV